MKENMNIALVGLGLIGGSMAKALKENTNNKIFGFDICDQTLKKAILLGAIDAPLTDDIVKDMDLIIVALYPQATIEYVLSKADMIKKGAIVMDCSGVKEVVCDQLEPVAKEKGFVFMGAHPMAGLEHSGFAYAKKALFNNASMVLTPAKGTSIEDVELVKTLCEKIGFTNMQISTPKEHDKMIAFTSQLAHVVSSAYIKSPTALKHEGFSAGSYKDLTRVAKLNEEMWSELFLENAPNLVDEITNIIGFLEEYKSAISQCNETKLKKLLKEGTERKIQIDGEKF